MSPVLSARYRSALACGASLFALAYSQPAAAQQGAQPTADTGGAQLEEVVVTARRVEEKAQAVPISLQTFNMAALEEQHILGTFDLATNIPGLQLANGAAGSPESVIYLRGVGGVGEYLDGVPTSLNGLGYDFDLANVEVLKGPQGTTFGLATNGGAIVNETKKPTNNYEGFAQVEFGDYGHKMFQGVLNVPIVDEKLLLRVGYENNYTDGYIDDIVNHTELNQTGYQIYRVSVTANPIDNLSNTTMLNYYTDPLIQGLIAELYRINLGTPTPPLEAVYGAATIARLYALQGSLGYYKVAGSPIIGGTYGSVRQWNIVNTTTYDINDALTLKNIAGYVEIQNGPTQGASVFAYGLPVFPLKGSDTGFGPQWSNQQLDPNGPSVQYTEEAQILGRFFDDKLSFVAGTFNAWTGTRGPHNISYGYNFGSLSGTAGEANSQTHAVYINTNFDLSDFVEGLRFEAGGRQSWDRQHTQNLGYTGAGCVNGCPPGPAVLTATSTRSGGWESPDYTVSLKYNFTPNQMVFVTNSNGFTRGGFNTTLNIPSQYQSFGPENLNNVEVGIKSDWDLPYDMKLRTNFNGFYGFYNQVNVVNLVTVPNAAGTGLTTTLLTTNAAVAHVEGLEGEITLIPDPSLELYVDAGYGYDKYDKYSLGTVDYTNAKFIYFPKWKGSGRITYHVPSSIIDESYGKLSFIANYTYEGTKADYTVYPVPPQDILGPWHNVDMSLIWKEPFGKTGVEFRAYVTNLLKNHYADGGNSGYVNLGQNNQIPAIPRMWGVSLKYDFGS